MPTSPVCAALARYTSAKLLKTMRSSSAAGILIDGTAFDL